MRSILVLAAVLLTGCDYGFTFHPEEMTPDQMLQRADLAFIGVIQAQNFDSWAFFRIPVPDPAGRDPKWWWPLRRRVRVETVLRGSYAPKDIDVYEIHWVGSSMGDWNFTHDHDRYLFMVHQENGRWHIVRDWWRSIYEVHSGYHARMPLDESRPFWERYALMNYWIAADQAQDQQESDRLFHHDDPGAALSQWQKMKLLRGLLGHPQPAVRLNACGELMAWGQSSCSPSKWDQESEKTERDSFAWDLAQGPTSRDPASLDSLRLYTTLDQPALRREFCRTFMARFPTDTDNGCIAGKPPPATIVTEKGDVPLVGDWPSLPQR